MKDRKFIIILLVFLPSFFAVNNCAFARGASHHSNEFPPGSSTTNITICNNQLPYLWNGITCLTAGTYSATLTGSNGADSTAVLNLFVINISTSITNAIICTNELPYQWNGNNYNSDGTYSVTLTSSSGCDSVPILSLTVNDVVTSTTNRTICETDLPFAWNGNNYSSTGTYNSVLTSTAGCDSIATLNLLVLPAASSITTREVCSNALPYFWNGNSYNASGSFPLTLIAANGCDSIATLVLTVKPLAGFNVDVNLCANELPYSWNGNSYMIPGNYPVTLAGSNGCDSIVTLRLTVRPEATSTTSVTVCNGQLPYSWNGNNYPAAGLFPVTLTAANGCDSIAKLRLTVVPFFTSTIDRIICNSDLPFTWNGIDYSSSGTYTASFVTAAGCDSIATLDLTVSTPHVGTDSMFVCPDQLPLNLYGQTFMTGGVFAIDPPFSIDACNSIDTLVLTEEIIIPGLTTATVCENNLPFLWNGNSYTASGVYGITLVSSTGCDSLSTLNLTVLNADSSITSRVVCASELPLIWNGANYTASGTYFANLVSANGCDSVARLDLSVNEVSSSLTTLSVCNSQLPFSWNGNTYSSSGTYVTTLTGSGGCDSIATLQLDVQGFLSSTTNTSICSNQLPYSWNGISYPAAGTFSITIVTAGGCDSIATLNLQVNDTLTSTTIINTCANQLPFTWNGIDYNLPGTYNADLITQAGCDSIATLVLAIGSTASSISDIRICNNQLPFSWNGNSYPQAGIYAVNLLSSTGCDSTATLNLVVTDILTSMTNVTVCPALLPYQWNGNTYTTGGTYSVTLSTPAGCDSVPILSLTVAPYVESSTDVTICTGELPYSWNGNTYSAAGTYSVLLTGMSVCDSLATLNLLTVAPVFSTLAVAICSDQLPYNWNGRAYTSSGRDTIRLLSSSGCDSLAILDLTVNSLQSSETIVEICDNQLPYNWNGNSYAASGSYVVNLSSAAGCDSIATLVLTASQTVTGTSTIAVCSNQLPYSWNGNTYTSSGTYSFNTTGSSGCDSIARLVLNIVNPTNSDTYMQVCNEQIPFAWNSNSYTATGDYTVTLTSAGGCDSLATLHLTVNDLIENTIELSACVNALPFSWNGQQLSSAGPYTAILQNAAGCDSIVHLNFGILLQSFSTTNVTVCTNELPFNWNGLSVSSAGAYSDTLLNAAGCDSIARLVLVVRPPASSITNRSVCSSTLPFAWNGQQYSSSGTYTAMLTTVYGCDSLARLELLVLPSPAAPSATSSETYCQFAQATALNATGSDPQAMLLWYNSASGGTGSSAVPVPSTQSAGTQHFYVAEVDGPCEGPRTTVVVIVHPTPDTGPDKQIQLCFGQSLNLLSVFDTSGLVYSWALGNQLITDTLPVTTGGNYLFAVENAFGCRDSAGLLLGFQPEIIANAGADADAEANVPFQLTGSGGGFYQWSPAHLFNNPASSQPSVRIDHDQELVLTVSDAIGCIDLDTVKLRVLNGPTFYVPSAFTPNGDGLNDIFRPTPVGIKKLDFFRVFNRYGELVFETSEIGKGWDGMYKGKNQPGSGYVWFLKGTDRLDKLRVMKGNVVLIR